MSYKFGKAHIFGVITAAAIFVLGFALTIGKVSQKAAAISGLTFAVSDATISATSTATVNLTAANAVTASSRKIHIEFQGLNGSGCPTSSASLGAGTSPTALSLYSTYCNQIVLTSSSTIAAGTAITVQINNFKNFTNVGTYFAHAWLADGSTDVEGSSEWGGTVVSNGVQFGTPNLTGTATAGGSGVAWANYHIRNSDSSVNVYGYTGADGALSASLPNGTYTASLYSPSSTGTGSTTIYVPPAGAALTVAGANITWNPSYSSPTKTIAGKVTYDSASGSPVTNARIQASRNGGGGWGSVRVASDGSFSFATPGGDWYLSISSNTSGDWIYNNCGSSGGDTVSFANDTTPQSATKNFVVNSLNSTATFTVKKPDGSAPTAGSVWVNFSLANNTCSSFSASIDSSGVGTAKLASGTYSVNGSTSDNSLSFPTVANFTVGVAAAINLGTFTLLERDSRIVGTVKASTGEAIAGAYVNGWVESTSGTPGSSEWSSATSGADGSYSMPVTGSGAGKKWRVGVSPPSGSGGSSDYAYSWEPVDIVVKKNSTNTKNWTLKKNSNTVNGKIVGEDGATLTSLNGSVNASEGGSYGGGGGYAQITSGAFTLKLPSGTFSLTAYFWESGGASTYDAGDPVKVTFTGDNQTTNVSLTAVRASAKIQGKVYDTSGKLITNQWVSIHATKQGKMGSWKSANYTQSTGEYVFNVSPGTWTVGFYMPASTGYMSSVGQEKEITVKDGETAVYDIYIKEAKFKVYGKTKKWNGDALPWAGVTVDSRDPSAKTSTYESYFGSYATSNGSGDYEVKLPEGAYFVGGSSWWGTSSQLNPKRVKISLNDANPSAEVNLTFREANAEITGTTKVNGSGADAYVTAHDASADTETNAGNSGGFTVKASQGTTWIVSATYVDGKKVYRSKPKPVEVTSDKVSIGDIELTEQKFTLPAPLSATFDPTVANIVTLEDQTTLSIPANSLATSGNVTLTATPTATLPEENAMDPLAYGYDFTAQNTATGQEITTFQASITVASTYNDTWLTDSGVAASELVPAYYDETVGDYKAMTSYVVDPNAKTVTYSTNHFTKFALVAATDTTPPSAPSDIKVTEKNESATLTWTNPTDADFSSITVYRSTEKDKLGDKIKTGATGTSHDDTGLTNGTTYYYTVRSVDKTGNESVNASQVSATPSVEAGIKAASGGVLPSTGRPAANNYWFYGLVLASLGLVGLKRLKFAR